MACRIAMPDRRSATAGEQFYVTDARFQRALGVPDDSTPVTVKPKADGTLGEWMCITCCQAFENNMMKDSHCRKPKPRRSALVQAGAPARHVLAWHSLVTGDVEVP